MKVFKKIACFMLVIGLVLTSGIFVACGKEEKTYSKSDALTIINTAKSNMNSATALKITIENNVDNDSTDNETMLLLENVHYSTAIDEEGYTCEFWVVLDASRENGMIEYMAKTKDETTTYTKDIYTYDDGEEFSVCDWLNGHLMIATDEFELTENNIESIIEKNGTIEISIIVAARTNEFAYETVVIKNGYVISSKLSWTDNGENYEYSMTYTWNENVDAELLNRANNIPDVEWVEN